MGREDQIVQERLRKLGELKANKINPYPNKYDKKQNCLDCLKSKTGSKVKTAGRLMTKRDLGKIAFCVLKDESGKIQLVLQDGETPQKEKGFLEVETPVLENSAGGAAATPFKTHHNALDIDVFLRISMGELWQKKLMVAGYEKTFEIGRMFRNEGMDMEHLQDYTQMEFYWAYANYEDGMKLVEEMYKKIAKEVFETLKFETHNYKIDLGKKWEKYDFEQTIKKYTEIEIYKTTEEEIKKKLKEVKIDFDPNLTKWKLVDLLWKYCRKKISGPGFLINQPVELSPLAKRNPEDKRKVEQFQVIIAGTELGNGYSELNDSLDQEQRFQEQMKLKEKGDKESMEHDKSFVEALKYGMPPTCGFGVSERLFSYLMNKPIRECVIFPLMKAESGE